ncbi:MAG: glycoside hydrolase family 95 protein [Muribaculaceae bacterium]|nr:glycoside hydrolase family 95 protein [Muribaculaceae bacterium]
MKHVIIALASALLPVISFADTPYTLNYNTPAKYFEEALPVGNGNLGALVYGRTGLERISLNDITLWTGEPEPNTAGESPAKRLAAVREALAREDYAAADSLQRFLQGHYSQNYQPLGTLRIQYDETPDSSAPYSRSLDISDAIADVHFGSRSQRVFASAPDSVIVIRLDNPDGLRASLRLESKLPVEISANGDEIIMDGYCAYHSMPGYASKDGDFRYDPGRGIHFRTILKALAPEGTVTAAGDSLTISGCREATLLLSNVSSFNGFDRDPMKQGRDFSDLVRRRIDRAASLSPDSLQARAVADHRSLMSRVDLDLGTTAPEIAALPTDQQLKQYTDSAQTNPDLEELYYQYGRYLLIACSRTPGVPANLQGLWNESLTPPWSSNYTTNINLQENYWGAETGSLPELHTVLLDYIDNLTASGAVTARNHWDVDSGWCLGHNTDIWAMTTPVGLGNDKPQWANWNMGGAWLASHIWEHYLFGRDKAELAERYPTLRGAALFVLDWLVERDGLLTTWPSTSPENNFLTPDGKACDTSIGTTADMAIIRQCLADTRAAAIELATDESLIARIDSVLPRLRPYEIKPDGSLNEWSHSLPDVDPQHRHQSHLYGLYPGHHISVDNTPEIAAAAARTLDIKGKETTGWSAGWRVNLLARLRDRDGAYAMLRRLLRYVTPDKYKGPDRRRGGGTYPNLLDAHTPFQIDGNFGGSAGIAEMLIQSTPDTIILLPTLPAAWPDGHISGIATRTGMTASVEWKDGKPVALTLAAPSGGTATIIGAGEPIKVALSAGETRALSF